VFHAECGGGKDSKGNESKQKFVGFCGVGGGLGVSKKSHVEGGRWDSLAT